MRGGEPVAGVDERAQHLARRVALAQPVGEVRAVDQLHRDVVVARIACDSNTVSTLG